MQRESLIGKYKEKLHREYKENYIGKYVYMIENIKEIYIGTHKEKLERAI